MRTAATRWSRVAGSLAVAAIVTLTYACQDGTDSVGVAPGIPMADAVDDFTDGGAFLWLAPLLEGQPTSPLQPGLTIDIEICWIDDPLSFDANGRLEDGYTVIECTTQTATEQDDFYGALWDTDRNVHENESFRIAASIAGEELGYMVVNLDGGFFNDGRTYPVRLWAGAALASFGDCVGSDRCDANLVQNQEGDQDPVVIQATQSPTGKVIAELTIDPDILPEDLVVTLDCRATLEDPNNPGNPYDPGDGPLPTDLNQYPVFCHVDALTSDGSDFTGSLTGDAILDICVIDEGLVGSDYHPLLETRLGKSNGPGDFVILPEGPASNLSDCSGVEILASDPGQVGFLESVGSRFAALFEPLMPAPLHADMFSDGGVTALLGSFSDINPVEPAFIGGTVTGAGVGVAGVDLQLSGGPLTSPLPTATTGSDGTYSFSEALDAAEGGGTTYTVTVTGGSVPLAQFVETSKQVSVTGSGTFTADFEAVGVLFDGETLADGSGVVWDWVVGSTSGTATAPFATNEYAPCTDLNLIIVDGVGTEGIWPLGSDASPSVITLTKQFFVPSGTTGLTLTGWVDNDAKVLLNGNDITATALPTQWSGTLEADGFVRHEGCANLNPLVFTATDSHFTAGAINTFEIQVKDRGVVGYADFQLDAEPTSIN